MGSRLRLRLVLCGGAVLVAAIVFDLVRPPERQLSARALVASIQLYRVVGHRIAPKIGVRCRMRPSCSRYAEEVITRHGAVRGGWLTVRRLLRCGPWTPLGTVDRPPGV